MAEESKNTESTGASSFGEIFKSLPLDDLKQNFTDYISAWSDKAIGGMGDKVSGLIDNMGAGDGGSGAMGQAAKQGAAKLAEGESPVKAGLSAATTGVKEAVGGGGSGGSGGGGKFTSIIKTIDVGVPLSVAYNQWTQFEDWTDFMKKVESVEQESEEKINFKGQVFWSHRTWNSTIIQQVADEQMVWRSTGEKGHFDGAVTFHEVAPRLTRIIAMVDYYPQGFMEKTGNIWRAVHRRVKVEMDRYIRQVMTSTILDPDSVEGWRGEIRDSEVVRSHEEVVEEEQAQQEQQDSDADQSQDTESSAEDAQADEDAPVEEEPIDEETFEDEAADDSTEAEEEAPAEDEEEEAPVDEAPAEDEEEVPAEEESAEDEEPVEDEAADDSAEAEEEAPVDEEEEAPAEDEEASTEAEAPAEDEEASTEEEPAQNTGSKAKSSPSKRSSSSSKSGSGSKSTRSTSKRSSSGSKSTRSNSRQRQTKRS